MPGGIPVHPVCVPPRGSDLQDDLAEVLAPLDPALGGLKLTGKSPTADVGKVVLPSKEAGVRLRGVK